jgi:hypothetical protein
MAPSVSEVIVPPSASAVQVYLVNTTACMTVRAESFIMPVPPGLEFLNLTVAAFLLEHPASGQKVMFDLGVRKDYWNYASILQKRIGTVIPGLKVDSNVPEVLKDGGVSPESICTHRCN